MDFHEQDEVSSNVMEPQAKLKQITKCGVKVDIDATIAPKRYYRSGLEMVRMANTYMNEGSLENAYILFMKFMTLFLEKIREHPNFSQVTATEKQINQQKLREVLPKAEMLKTKLLLLYGQEYERHLNDKRRKEAANREKELQMERLKLDKENIVIKLNRPIPSQPCRMPITPVPNITGDLYPDEFDEEPKPTQSADLPVKPQHLSVVPSVNRTNKPNLLSPSVNLPHSRLRTVVVPGNLIRQFLTLAQRNTGLNVETCGTLTGSLRMNELFITHLLIPQQTGSSDSCDTEREEDIFEFQDQNDLITFGWIHTHPTQTAFLSSVDLHTHCSYQRMMPEAIAIVCAPRYSDNKFFCLTPDYGLDFIANCRRNGFHPHPTEPELYTVADHVKIDSGLSVQVVDLRISKN